MLEGVTEDLPHALLADMSLRLLTHVANTLDYNYKGQPNIRAQLHYDVCQRYHEHETGSTPCTKDQIKASYRILPMRKFDTEFRDLAPCEPCATDW